MSESIITLPKQSGQQPKTPSQQDETWSILALTRFVLAMIVVATHLPDELARDPLSSIVRHLSGTAAVLCFFVISGYSIAHSIQTSPQGFYQRRANRILPLYLACVAFSAIPYLPTSLLQQFHLSAMSPLPEAPYTLLGNVFFLQGIAVGPIWTNLPLWSIGIEVCFYALAPLLLKLNIAKLVLLAYISAAACFLDRLHQLPIRDGLYGVPMLVSGWAWLMGFAYYLSGRKPSIGYITLLMGSFLLCAYPETEGIFRIPCFVAFMIVMFQLSNPWDLTKRVRNFMNYAGDLSYPLYLFHYPLFILIAASAIRGYVILYVIAALALAAIVYHGIDVPFRKIGRSKRQQQS